MTTTWPADTFPAMIPAMASSCESKQMAWPVNCFMPGSMPAVFTTTPSRARLPKRTAMPPTGL